MKEITYEYIKTSKDIKTYITRADDTLIAMGYTEHSFAHVTKCAIKCSEILEKLGFDARICELGKIAGYMHDIGNVINRIDHAQSGAVMAFRLLDKVGMCADEIATVISAIGNHDEATATPINAVAAALILADKSDVRRSRVRSVDVSSFDIHDRVNYAVVESDFTLDTSLNTITLSLKIDTEICAVMDYFEIFLSRMLLCRRAAEYLGLKFKLAINGVSLL
ncbi:MAG: phosphohydrolase [Oscillospiraceae bacterium]